MSIVEMAMQELKLDDEELFYRAYEGEHHVVTETAIARYRQYEQVPLRVRQFCNDTLGIVETDGD